MNVRVVKVGQLPQDELYAGVQIVEMRQDFQARGMAHNANEHVFAEHRTFHRPELCAGHVTRTKQEMLTDTAQQERDRLVEETQLALPAKMAKME